MTDTLEKSMLEKVYAWHMANGPKPLPATVIKDGVEVESEFSGVYKDLTGYVAHNKSPNDPGFQVDGLTIPLISGAIAGFSDDEMTEIARHYAPDAYLAIIRFDLFDGNFELESGKTISVIDVYIRCFQALERANPKSIIDIYNYCPEDYQYYIIALTHASNRDFWPSSLLARYCATALGSGEPPSREISPYLHNFFLGALDSIYYVPHDEHGPRFDWLLERSGMLMPEVTGKTLGQFCMWEEFLDLAVTAQPDSVINQLFRYCIGEPPGHLRNGIEEGLRSICADSSSLAHAVHIFVYLSKTLPGTWLEPVLKSEILMLNCMGSADLQRIFESTEGGLEAYLTLFENTETLPQRIYDEVMANPSPSYHHLDAVRHLERLTTDSQFRPDFSREAYIIQLVKIVQQYPGCDHPNLKDAEDISDEVRDLFRRALALVTNDKPFDYKAFAGLDSDGVRILVEEGFDMKRLPRMNRRDRGRTLEHDLGM